MKDMEWHHKMPSDTSEELMLMDLADEGFTGVDMKALLGSTAYLTSRLQRWRLRGQRMTMTTHDKCYGDYVETMDEF